MANVQIIKDRWEKARKVYGLKDVFLTPSGFRIDGQYVITEAGACTPSHDPLNGFVRSEGFPTDKNGQNVNDRDYEYDKKAKEITRNIAIQYDSRAIQSPVVVSNDGIVLSGNGRTMAGILAAKDNTDAAYISYLYEFCQKYGFTQDDVSSFNHPRIVFLADDEFEYTTKEFAMFNAPDTKKMDKTEDSVSLGKRVSDDTFHRIIRNINTFDTLGDFYNSSVSIDAIHELMKDGAVDEKEFGELVEGDNGSITVIGREKVENVLIGKAFQTNPNAVRQITTYKVMRKNIITALAEISNNIAMVDYSLEREMADAIDLVYNAKSSGYSIADYTLQPDAFSGRKAYVTDTTVIMLADMVNHEQSTRLKRLFVVYNAQAKDSANGQVDMFSGGVKSKEEILDEVKAVLNYSTKRLNDHLQNVTEQRKHEARTSIFMEEATSDDAYKNVTANVEVGSWCSMRLPNGETMTVKYEYLKGSEAGIRLKGFKRMFVPVSLLSPTADTKPTLTKWWNDCIDCYSDIVTLLAKKDSNRLVA